MLCCYARQFDNVVTARILKKLKGKVERVSPKCTNSETKAPNNNDQYTSINKINFKKYNQVQYIRYKRLRQ